MYTKSMKISYETVKRNASTKNFLPHCELAVIMQNSTSETTKTRKKSKIELHKTTNQLSSQLSTHYENGK